MQNFFFFEIYLKLYKYNKTLKYNILNFFNLKYLFRLILYFNIIFINYFNGHIFLSFIMLSSLNKKNILLTFPNEPTPIVYSI